MLFKLIRLTDTDIFYLAAKDAECVGTEDEILIEGTFNEVFSFAAQMKLDEAVDLGSGEYHQITNANDLTDIQTAKWILIDLNNLYQMTDLQEIQTKGVLQILRTDGGNKTSLPLNRYTTTGTLDEIFNRVYVYVSNLLSQ